MSLAEVLDVIRGALDAQPGWRITGMTDARGLAMVASMILAAAILDLSGMALAAFAWFEGNASLAALFAAAAFAATAGFVVLAARRLRQVPGSAS